jgi:hypothetical protein
MAIDGAVVTSTNTRTRTKITPLSLITQGDRLMKSVSLFLSTIVLSGCAAILSTSDRPAAATCVVSDINFQVSMNGSRKATDRTNNVNQNVDPNCQGNSVSTTNVQVQRGGVERATQNREVNVNVGGGSGNRSGVNGPSVVNKTNVQIDIDNPVDRWKAERNKK